MALALHPTLSAVIFTDLLKELPLIEVVFSLSCSPYFTSRLDKYTLEPYEYLTLTFVS